MVRLFLVLFSLLFFTNLLFAGTDENELRAPRSTSINYVEGSPKIDGVINDAFWAEAESETTNFIQFQPDNGEKSSQKTQIKLAYTDFGIYIAARMYDEPENIQKELSIRDDDGKNTDQFGVLIDTYNQGQNAFYFKVSAAGVQTDIYVTRNGQDYNWDAVWASGVTFLEDGWSVEMEIPYSAIRFAKEQEQEWGINFMRKIQQKGETSYWSFVDNSIDGLVNQSGTITGLTDIKPPLRLSVSPYVTAYYTKNENGAETSVTGGMDLKYGFTESFTLDMTLIPDFGQVQSDNLVYNLGPFEVQYAENRPFFTEGTELFDKGGLFYSRRVGQSFGSVSYDDDIDSLVSRPGEAPLINATKITGRTKNGTGIGVFNAVTNQTYAKLYNKETGVSREQKVDDLTNFNVLVFDQNLKNNSNFSVINTNVTRYGTGDDANVVGSDLTLNDKTNTYRLRAFGAYTHINQGDDGIKDGYKYNVAVAKVSGKYQFNLSRNVESEDYDPNDMGFLRSPNEISHSVSVGYNEFKPKGNLNRFQYWLGANYSQLYEPKSFQRVNLWNDFWLQTKNFYEFSVSLGGTPRKSYDYFEPRVEGEKFFRPWNYNMNMSLRTDSRKKFMTRISGGLWNAPDREQFDYWMYFGPRYRVSNRMSLQYGVEYNKQFSSIGFAELEYLDPEETEVDKIYFGERDIDVFSNVFSVNYTINNKMGFNVRMRHYWTKVDYFDYYELQGDGDISGSNFIGKENESDPFEEHDTNYNAFNIDAVYSWQIAPGSFINVVWKDAAAGENERVDYTYKENISELFSKTHNQNLSVRLIYYLDYMQVKRSINRG